MSDGLMNDDFYVQREHVHNESVHYYIEHKTVRGREVIQEYTKQGPINTVDFWGRGAKSQAARVYRELVMLRDKMFPPPPPPEPEELPEGVLELGVWCHAEGIYDGSGRADHGYGYPCEGRLHDHVPAAVVRLPL